MAFASFACWATMQRAWLEAGIGLLNHPSSPVASDDPLLVATARDWRSCGDAMIQAQLETLESWRRAS